jgi:hypothetical protein
MIDGKEELLHQAVCSRKAAKANKFINKKNLKRAEKQGKTCDKNERGLYACCVNATFAIRNASSKHPNEELQTCADPLNGKERLLRL